MAKQSKSRAKTAKKCQTRRRKRGEAGTSTSSENPTDLMLSEVKGTIEFPVGIDISWNINILRHCNVLH